MDTIITKNIDTVKTNFDFLTVNNEAKEPVKTSFKPIKKKSDSDIPIIENITLNEALERFVLIINGSRVIDLANPDLDMKLQDFHNAYSASTFWNAKKEEYVSTTRAWLASDKKMAVKNKSFKAGAPRMIEDPDGNQSLNLWNGFKDCGEAPDNQLEHVHTFAEHIKLIFGSSSEKFLDWIAHILQKPGELPHYGWISIATNTGIGRNWLSSVLEEIFSGYFAPNFDLSLMLETGFNGGLSRKVLAVIDEIQEGGSGQWKHAQKLKSAVNPRKRQFNPKYGFQHVEWNSCRFLIFSNHVNAIPLDETDRRFAVVLTEQKPRDEAYYDKLHKLLYKREFIASIADFLKNRDISKFNPGERPDLNEAKKRMIDESKSEAQKLADEIAQFWPTDIISTNDIADILNLAPNDKQIRHVCEGAKMITYCKTIAIKTGEFGRVRIIRNHDKWINASSAEIRSELVKDEFLSAKEILVKAIENHEKDESIPF